MRKDYINQLKSMCYLRNFCSTFNGFKYFQSDELPQRKINLINSLSILPNEELLMYNSDVTGRDCTHFIIAYMTTYGFYSRMPPIYNFQSMNKDHIQEVEIKPFIEIFKFSQVLGYDKLKKLCLILNRLEKIIQGNAHYTPPSTSGSYYQNYSSGRVSFSINEYGKQQVENNKTILLEAVQVFELMDPKEMDIIHRFLSYALLDQYGFKYIHYGA